jgi:hypothetical protein
VTFPLIPEAVKDGYAPLQVYVPIMEAISAGTGTQSVFLCLDWDTLKSAAEDDDDFNDNQNENQSQNENPGNTSTPQSSPAFNHSLTGGNGSNPGGSASAKNSAAGSIGKSSISSQTKIADTGLSELAGLSSEVAPMAETPAKTAAETQAARQDTISSGEASDERNPAAIPTVMSVLMTGAGILFKLKSRGGL